MNTQTTKNATRYCFYIDKNLNVMKKEITFHWFSGFSKEQKNRSIHSFLDTTAQQFNIDRNKILEICKLSPNSLGQQLSAFNLLLTLKNNQNQAITANVERFFQGAKVFGKKDDIFSDDKIGAFEEIIIDKSLHPKRYQPLANVLNEVKNGKLQMIAFQLFGQDYPLNPKNFFYDYLYITALIQNKKLSEQLLAYEYFSDIEFNPKKAINCQAKSAAIYVSMLKKGIVQDFIEQDNDGLEKLNKEKFLQEYQNSIFIER